MYGNPIFDRWVKAEIKIQDQDLYSNIKKKIYQCQIKNTDMKVISLKSLPSLRSIKSYQFCIFVLALVLQPRDNISTFVLLCGTNFCLHEWTHIYGIKLSR